MNLRLSWLLKETHISVMKIYNSNLNFHNWFMCHWIWDLAEVIRETRGLIVKLSFSYLDLYDSFMRHHTLCDLLRIKDIRQK